MRGRVVPGLGGLSAGLSVALATTLVVGGPAGCDPENLQERLQDSISRQEGRAERQDRREAERASHGRDGLAPAVRDALNLIADSDAEFIVKKHKKADRSYSAANFAAMLTSKTFWLGRGIEDVDLWIHEIGAGSFIQREAYEVRRPDGIIEEFAPWISRQLAERPRTAEELAAEAVAAEEAAAAAANRRRRR